MIYSKNSAGVVKWPTLTRFPVQVKALVTTVVLTMSFAMLGALGQIIVHDIIPTFFSKEAPGMHMGHETTDKKSMEPQEPTGETPERGDLFNDMPKEVVPPVTKPIYKTDQFVWLLKWTHIHLFGMNMIFIFIGAITTLLNLSVKIRTWLVVLPFVGIVADIAAMWLKTYVSPDFFWLHVPGGGLFVSVFILVSLRAIWEMWIQPHRSRQ